MYVLCNIPDETYKKIVKKCVNSQMQAELTMPTIARNIANGIAVPDNITTGGMINAIFPAMTTYVEGGVVKGDRNTRFDLGWWNAKYRKGKKI